MSKETGNRKKMVEPKKQGRTPELQRPQIPVAQGKCAKV